MLPFDFDYYRPETLKEAVDLFQRLDRQGKQPIFFSGGTELITLGRIDLAYTESVIDIKNIQENRKMENDGSEIILGGAISLLEVEKINLFPLLSKTASEIADHTSRGKITLGGNICARIFYREAVLPFLLADSYVTIAGPAGIKSANINQIFSQQLQLERGELLVSLTTHRSAAEAPYISIKRRQQWKTGYPLVTINALNLNGELRVAFSGLCPFPFRLREMEDILNNRHFTFEERMERALEMIPGPILDDVEGSADYRIFVFKRLLLEVYSALGE